jgi:predicted nucleotidyltransferase
VVSATLVGSVEAAALLGVRPSNFLRDYARRPDFPRPIANLARGHVWERSAVERYRATLGRRRGVGTSRLPLAPDASHSLAIAKRRLVRRFRPTRIVVFGSQARGEGRPDSDLDLLVVRRDVANRHRTRVEMIRALADLPVEFDILVASESEVRQRSGLRGLPLSEALAEGQTIYASR